MKGSLFPSAENFKIKVKVGEVIYIESFPGCSERNYLLIKNYGRTIIFPNTKTLERIVNCIN